MVPRQPVYVDDEHDAEITIAIAASRTSTHLKNVTMKWSAFIHKLQQAKQVTYSLDEYLQLPKAKQDEIKDVGGFIGGSLLSDGNKTLDNIKARRMITLDADEMPADQELWSEYQHKYGNAAVLYSTIKHKLSAPRLRLCILLDRDVSSDEYVAIARKVASDLTIDYFDVRSYVPAQIMYWSTSLKNGDRVFEYINEEPLCADDVLATYKEWRDHTSHARAKKEWKIEVAPGAQRFGNKKQQDPRTKEGLIGAFCRTYTIHQAIQQFIPDVYIQSARDPNRYTYCGASTTNGAVVYEDLFLYSNHGTDPYNMQLMNAFDLVMNVKFGDLDDHEQLKKPKNRRASFIEMMNLIKSDPNVMVQEFESTETPDVDERPLIAKLKRSDKGKILGIIDNVVMILQEDEKLKGKLRFDDFAKRRMYGDRLFTDADEIEITRYIEKRYEITNYRTISSGIYAEIHKNTFHPVCDYLNALEWDGVPRVDRLLVDVLGADDTEYVRMVTRKTLVGAIARIMEPGCKFDTMLIMTGPQGVGKSSLFDCLATNWFSDSMDSFNGKDAYELIQGKWIIEVGELAALNKAGREKVKQFLSKREDNFRPAYGRNTIECKRQCVFIGTTNEDVFLYDETGERRAFPVEVKGAKEVREVVTPWFAGQVWAEAKMFYEQGEPINLKSLYERELAEEGRIPFTFHDPLIEEMERFLNVDITMNWYEQSIHARRSHFDKSFGTEVVGPKVKREYVSLLEIACELFGMDPIPFLMNRGLQTRLGNVMKKIPGWVKTTYKKRLGAEYGERKVYRRMEDFPH